MEIQPINSYWLYIIYSDNSSGNTNFLNKRNSKIRKNIKQKEMNENEIQPINSYWFSFNY